MSSQQAIDLDGQLRLALAVIAKLAESKNVILVSARQAALSALANETPEVTACLLDILEHALKEGDLAPRAITQAQDILQRRGHARNLANIPLSKLMEMLGAAGLADVAAVALASRRDGGLEQFKKAMLDPDALGQAAALLGTKSFIASRSQLSDDEIAACAAITDRAVTLLAGSDDLVGARAAALIQTVIVGKLRVPAWANWVTQSLQDAKLRLDRYLQRLDSQKEPLEPEDYQRFLERTKTTLRIYVTAGNREVLPAVIEFLEAKGGPNSKLRARWEAAIQALVLYGALVVEPLLSLIQDRRCPAKQEAAAQVFADLGRQVNQQKPSASQEVSGHKQKIREALDRVVDLLATLAGAPVSSPEVACECLTALSQVAQVGHQRRDAYARIAENMLGRVDDPLLNIGVARAWYKLGAPGDTVASKLIELVNHTWRDQRENVLQLLATFNYTNPQIFYDVLAGSDPYKRQLVEDLITGRVSSMYSVILSGLVHPNEATSRVVSALVERLPTSEQELITRELKKQISGSAALATDKGPESPEANIYVLTESEERP